MKKEIKRDEISLSMLDNFLPEIKRNEISLSMLDNFLPTFLTLYCSQSQLKKKVIIVPHVGLPRRSVTLSNYVTKLGTNI